MAGSRSFLLVLLLATVTCIVLIQVSLDGWIRPKTFKFYNFAVVNQRELKSDKNADIPDKIVQTSYSSNSTTITYSKPITVTQRKTTPKSNTDHHKMRNTSATSWQRVEAKVRVRNLTVGRPVRLLSSRKFPLQLQLQHEAQLQEAMKHKDMMQRRVKGDPMKGIRSMPVVNSTEVNRIFLITYFRSGSSFVGELLQQNYKTFYQFEPLHYMTYGSRISRKNQTQEALELFDSIYRCNFTGFDDYFNWVRKPKNQFLFTRSLFLWFTCRSNFRTCFMPEYVSSVCKRAPVQIIKTTRLHMWQLKLFLDANPDLNIKVVYLTRDPRGIISSRWSLSDWCNGTECSDPDIICSEMRNDTRVFNELRSKQPSKFIQVRYEDMSINPKEEATKLFQFLGLSVSQSVKRYLKSHTTARKSDNLDPYSTKRNSSSMAYSWKKRFNFEQVKTVQNVCHDVIENLNYSMINNATELNNFNVSENRQLKKINELIHTKKIKKFHQLTHNLNPEFLNQTHSVSVLVNDSFSKLKKSENVLLTKITVIKKLPSEEHLNNVNHS